MQHETRNKFVYYIPFIKRKSGGKSEILYFSLVSEKQLTTTVRGDVNMTRILVIDDEAQIRAVLLKSLERDGYQVMDAPNGKVGMKLFQEEPFDLVITDIVMPEKDGIEIIGELRRYFPETKIIAISGGGRILKANYVLHTAETLGAHCTLSKPFELEEFLNAVKHVLGRDKK
jgi:DNA-binding response OmpR family regulator